MDARFKEVLTETRFNNQFTSKCHFYHSFNFIGSFNVYFIMKEL
jgi:hypothetical protein